MKRDYYKDTDQELSNKYDKFIKERNEYLKKSYIISENRFEERVAPLAGGFFVSHILLTFLLVLMDGSHVIAFTEGVNYLLPILNIIPISIFPLVLIGISLGVGKLFSLLNEKFTKTKKRFKEISNAKTEKEKIEEMTNYEIKALQCLYRCRVMTNSREILHNHHEEFDILDKKFDINNINLPQTYEDTKKNIEDLEKQLEEKYKELDAIATKEVLHHKFYHGRFRYNRFEEAFHNSMFGTIMIMMMALLPFIAVGETLPFTQLTREIYALVATFGSLIGANAYAIKKVRTPLKVFKKINASLGKDQLPKKPNKDERKETSEIFKYYQKIEHEACLLEIQIQEQKRIKEIFESVNEDNKELDYSYSHANIPLMELSEDNVSETNDEYKPKMIVKK